MFKGKVTIIRNINGKEEKIEREFTSQKEYEKFLKEHSDMLPPSLPDPRLTLSEWGALGSFIDQIFEQKLSDLFLPDALEEERFMLGSRRGDVVDLSRYEQEIEHLEMEKEEKKEREQSLRKAVEKLKGYIKTFEKEGKKDLATSAKKDLKKLEEELKTLKQSKSK